TDTLSGEKNRLPVSARCPSENIGKLSPCRPQSESFASIWVCRRTFPCSHCERSCRHCLPTRRSSNGPGGESRDGREGDRCAPHSAATFVSRGLNRNEDTGSLTRQNRVSERNIREALIESPQVRQTRGISENDIRG